MMDMIGAASGSTFSMTGGSMSSGKSRRAILTLSRTSCAFTSTFSSSSNSIKTCERPSALVERSCLIPEIVLTLSSITSETSVSIVSGLAPSSVVVTATYGNSTSGKRSTPSRPIEIQPSTTNAPIIITARTGRLMDRSTSHITRTRAQRDRRRRRARRSGQ